MAAHPITGVGPAESRPVLLCGYYGEHNLGDDALLEALLAQLPAGVTPLVTAHDEVQVQARFGVATVPRRRLKAVLAALGRCRALVLGGGSLLQDATSFGSLLYYGALISAARLQGKPVLLWAQGLGPLRRRRSRALVRALLPAVSAISWRDPESAALAARLGRRAPHGADAVWSLPRQPWIGGGGPIVVCWRPTPLLLGEAWRPYLQALEQLAERQNREVLWLPFHLEQDRGLLDQLTSAGLVGEGLRRRSREVDALLPCEAMAVFRSAGLVLAMRLHALILAGLAGAPLAALSYDPKVRAAAAAIGCGCVDLGGGSGSPADLLEGWSAALDQPPAAAAIAALQQSTAVHRQLLDPLIP
ncbi:MAG: polysaccharide pyruvyl transferase CsaB [Cyanobacteriota bacterium]